MKTILGNRPVAILTSGNDPQVRQMEVMIKSARRFYQPNEVHFVVATDGMARENIERLQQNGIQVEIYDSDEAKSIMAKLDSDGHPFGKIGKPFMLKWLLEKMRSKAEEFAYFDPDVLVQEKLFPLFQFAGDSVVFGDEFTPTIDHKYALRRLSRATGLDLDRARELCLQMPEEVNTGVIMGKVTAGIGICEKWSNFILEGPFSSFCRSGSDGGQAWHDQDFFRAWIRVKGMPPFRLAPPGWIAHLCGTGAAQARYKDGKIQWHGGTSPKVAHFAGQSWRQFLALRWAYGRLLK